VRCVIVKNDKCNVRSGPGTDNDVLFTVDKGVPFRVLEAKGKWLHIMSCRTGIRDGSINLWCGRQFQLAVKGMKLIVTGAVHYHENQEWKTKIVGIGGALVDLLIHESDDFIQRIGFEKGGMTYVEPSDLDRILGRGFSPSPVIVPGGSAGNTAVGVGQLGGLSGFVGKRGDDESGRFFEDALLKKNVVPLLMTSGTPTGRVLSIITPDAQRTMLTYLGASARIRPEEITPECFSDAAIVHMEGYLLFNPEVMTASLKSAKQAGALISLDLASFTVVEQSKSVIDDIIAPYVDILHGQ
jgi:hypothetical protein